MSNNIDNNNKQAQRKIRFIEKLDLVTGNVLDVYDSQLTAARANNISQSAISAVCRGVMKSVGGFRWRATETERPRSKRGPKRQEAKAEMLMSIEARYELEAAQYAKEAIERVRAKFIDE